MVSILEDIKTKVHYLTLVYFESESGLDFYFMYLFIFSFFLIINRTQIVPILFFSAKFLRVSSRFLCLVLSNTHRSV